MRPRNLAFLFLLLTVVLLPGYADALGPSDNRTAITFIDRFYRTELYFGLSKPDGSLVDNDEWKNFLDREVTPRFADGFTVLDGAGQYRDKSGAIIKEPSKIIIFLYRKKARDDSRAKIEEIRTAYKREFNQESVLRVDIRYSIDVSF